MPIMSLELKGKEEWIRSTAYVDSGASYSIFHAEIAEILGIDLEKGELREMSVGDGNILRVYLHPVLINIANQEFEAYLGFSKGIGVGFNIIGRKSIFDRFIVCFHEKDKYVLDTSAIIAFLEDEAGADTVQDLLEDNV